MVKSPIFRFRHIGVFVGGAVLLGVAGLALAYANARHERSEATQLLEILSTVKVGSSNESEVLKAVEPFAGYEESAENSDRRRTESGVLYVFRNRIMSFLHLAPSKSVYVGIEFRGGIAVRKSVNVYQEPRFGVAVQEVMASGRGFPVSNNSRQLRTNVYGPQSTVIDVRDDNSVPVERRELDWQIDLSCMTAMMPCRNPQAILPGIFPPKS